jgi:formate dehydrogenase major subunit
LRQITGKDKLALGKAAQSSHQANLVPRTRRADHVTKSVCPYCAVGCGQRVYVKDGEVTQIEGDPDSPISRGRLCPKGPVPGQPYHSHVLIQPPAVLACTQ